MPPRLLPPLRALRSFSTTPHPRNVAPEHPKFIEIPQPPRTPPLYTPIVKGKLPPPKEIFPRVGPDKTSEHYLALVTPNPTKRKSPPVNKPEEAAYIVWKAKMAERRRTNLREGIIELAEKKNEFNEKRATVLAKRAAERQALLDRKEREDVRLTLPSILSTIKSPERFADPDRKRRLERKAKVLNKIVAAKMEARREQLHNLYLNASGFLLTEKQLDVAIHDEFPEEELEPLQKSFPLTVTEMLAQRAKGPVMANFGGLSARENEVVMEAAGALTGGKIAKGNHRQEDGKYEHIFKT